MKLFLAGAVFSWLVCGCIVSQQRVAIAWEDFSLTARLWLAACECVSYFGGPWSPQFFMALNGFPKRGTDHEDD